MMRYLCLLMLLLLPSLAVAQPYQLVPGQTLDLALPGLPWQASAQPPEFLITERIATLTDGMLAMMKKAGMTDKRMAVLKMLGNNELFIFNTSSGAHLEIDFSPLGADEPIPSAEMIKKSAEYAGQALAAEENYSDVSHRVAEFSLPGVDSAYRVDASYLRYGTPGQFVGVIGYSAPDWFFFYYTDPLANQKDMAEMELLLNSLRIERP